MARDLPTSLNSPAYQRVRATPDVDLPKFGRPLMAAPALQKSEPMTPLRTAPHNIEVERQLIGAILMNNETYFRVSDFLEANHFFIEQHRVIYEKIGHLIRASKVASPITVKTFYPPDAQIAEMPVAQYLLRLAADATTIINAEDYAHIIHDLAVRRALIGIGEQMVNTAYDSPVDLPPRQQIDAAERSLYKIAEEGRYDGGFASFSDALRDAMEMANAAYERQGGLSGISSGITSLDRMMGGLQASDLIILAARPAMGKTSLVTNIAFNVAAAYRGEEQAEIPSNKIRRGELTDHDFEKLVGATQMMQQLPLFIDATGGITIAQLTARARRLKRQKGLDLLIVDYLQLLAGGKKASENRVQEITEITTGLKALAKELKVPIVALSQLSRQVENRDDKRPQLSDLRESGSIEQDADVVMFIYREEYYLKGKEPPDQGSDAHSKWFQDMEKAKGVAEVIIGKQRHGPTGTVNLHFAGEFTRFSDLATSDYLPTRMD